jgi:EF-P beta-lysylation protein EpmB
MITEMLTRWQTTPTDWQHELRQAIRDPMQLLQLLDLSPSQLAQPLVLKPGFALRVPRSYVARMRKGDPDDPLLRQVLPVTAEQKQLPTFSLDPTGDKLAEKVPSLLAKYSGRVLLIVTGACAIHCRYCFRQHYNYSTGQSLLAAVEFIQADSSIAEVILSGGDPLTWTDNRLAELIHQLAQIPHLQRLRLHTRLPIVLPQRVTPELLKGLTQTRLQPLMVIHTNHANEIDESVGYGLQRLVTAGITVLNQSVLLRGVNANATALINLSEMLFNYRVLPYYLHLLDRVQGATHFEVPKAAALDLLAQMRIALPGYLVPQLVQEVAGMAYKQPIL